MKKKNIKKRLFSSLFRLFLIISFLIIISTLIIFNFGCSTENSSSSETKSIKTASENKSPDESLDEGQTKSSNEGTIPKTNQSEGEEQPNSEEEITINVYYADSQGEHLVGEERIVSSKSKYVDAINELMTLPVDENLVRLVPETTKINSITVEDGLAKVDLSKEFIEDRFISETVDVLLIYSIVNTLTEFPEVHSVSFYIDGEKLGNLGMLDIAEPMYRRTDLIAEK